VSETILVVDPDVAGRSAIVDVLRRSHYRTLEADGFPPAVLLLKSAKPNLLITAIRLGAFNGIHLIMRALADDARVSAIAIDDAHDAVQEREARQAGAVRYFTRSVGSDKLLRGVADALARLDRRHWTRTSVAASVPIRITAGKARLLDVSYAGFRLEFASWSRTLPNVLELDLPSVGLSVKAERVWSHDRWPAPVFWCGAAVALPHPKHSQRWRQLVDTLRGASASPSLPGEGT